MKKSIIFIGLVAFAAVVLPHTVSARILSTASPEVDSHGDHDHTEASSSSEDRSDTHSHTQSPGSSGIQAYGTRYVPAPAPAYTASRTVMYSWSTPSSARGLRSFPRYSGRVVYYGAYWGY